MLMKKFITRPEAAYCPPEMEASSLIEEGLLCESLNGTSLPDATYDDTGLTF